MLFAALLMLSACESESPYSGYSAYFVCDSAFPPFNVVTSPGEFVTVRGRNAASYEVTDPQGTKRTIQLTEQERLQGFFYGLGGFIIGTPMMCDGNVWAYDWACPECDMARYRLELNGVGLATCPNCAAVYDLNIGGVPIENGRKVLWRYNVMPLGTQFVIRN